MHKLLKKKQNFFQIFDIGALSLFYVFFKKIWVALEIKSYKNKY